jgi:hypothetical protein
MSYTRVVDFTASARVSAQEVLSEATAIRTALCGLTAADLDAVSVFDLPHLAQPYSIATLDFGANGMTLSDVPSDEARTRYLTRFYNPRGVIGILRFDLSVQGLISGASDVYPGDFTQLDVELLATTTGGKSKRLNTGFDLIGQDWTEGGGATVATSLITKRMDEFTNPTIIKSGVTFQSRIIVAVNARKSAEVTDARAVTFTKLYGSVTVAFKHTS